jgi:hypothetical protein
MDNVQKTAFTDYNAPSSEPFRLHQNHYINVANKSFENVASSKIWGKKVSHSKFNRRGH